MSNIIELTKVLIKNNVFAFSGRKKKGKQVSTKGSALGFAILLLFCVLAIGGPVVFVLINLLKDFDLSQMILSFVLPLGGITSIVFGVFSIVSVFYFSKDEEKLLHLPIKSSELLISKFIASLISEYLILLMFIYPIILGVGIGIGAPILYYFYFVIIGVLMPVIPSVIMAIVIMLFNKIFNFGKRKDFFMYVMTGLILLFSFAYSFGLQFLLDSEGSESVLSNLSMNVQMIDISKWLFPFFNSAVYALVNPGEFIGFASFMTFIGLNLLFLVILYFVGDRLYIKGLTKNGGNKQSKKKNLNTIYKESKSGVSIELMKKEWKIIKRTPIFMLNTIIVNAIFPLVFCVSFMIGFKDIEILLNYIDFSNSGIYLISLAILLFLCSLTATTSSSISREGGSCWMMKTIPVSLKKQLDIKVIFSMIVDFIILFVVEIFFMVFLKMPWYYLILVNIPLLLLLYIINYVGLLLDLRRPRLDWTEESEAVKQNFNVVLAMFFVVILIMAFIVAGVFIINKNINIYLLFSIMSLVLLTISITINIFVKKYQIRLFNKVV